LRLDPPDPADALARVIAEAAAYFDLGARRNGLLEQIGVITPPTQRATSALMSH